MAQKEIQVMDFVVNPKPYIDYTEFDVKTMEDELRNNNLSPMERRRLEKLYKECLLAQRQSLTQKNEMITEEMQHEVTTEKRVISKERIEQMRQEKAKVLHARKIVVYGAMAAVILAAAGVSFKVHYDKTIKPIKIINEKYDFVPTSRIVQSGQTLTSIAAEIYASYPDEVVNVKSLNDIIDEIVKINHLSSRDEIKEGQMLILPTYTHKQDLDESKSY